MHLPILWQAISLLLLVHSAVARQLRQPTKRDVNGPPSNFVTIQNGRFMVNGTDFKFIGTTAYWLSALNSDEDIDRTLGDIAAANFTVVRTWAFNDVTVIPENGTWFQLISNGTTSINNGTNGLQRLDKVVELAQKHGIYLIMSLTNNWNPHLSDSIIDRPIGFTARQVTNTSLSNSSLPRNTLSNDYGGMDTYVRELGNIASHDQFYTNETLINAFQNYTSQIVSRYVNHPNVMAWEVANDPRCNSTMGASSSCLATTVTKWHNTVATHIKSVDPNHIVSSGNQGFFCIGCPKLFQPTPTPPPAPTPQPSPAPGTRRGVPKLLTRASLLKERKELVKKIRRAEKAAQKIQGNGIRVRGRWVATPTKRQDLGIGPAFDGSHGVDSEDILNIPQIGFGSFQLFPDQNAYGPEDLTLPAFNRTVQNGLDWIQRQADAERTFNKPIVMTGFGLVTQDNAQNFVPFNTSVAPFGPGIQTPEQQSFGVSTEQRNDAYRQWINGAISGGLQGLIQYQWGQDGLTTQPGTVISTPGDSTGVSNQPNSTGTSPNDGYSIQGVGKNEIVQTIQQASDQFRTSIIP